MFGENAPRRPKYADLYAQQREPRENNARNVAELLERCRTDAEMTTRRKSVMEQTTLKIENQRKLLEQQITTSGRLEHTLYEFPAKKKDSCLHMRRRQATVDSTWLPRISLDNFKSGDISQKCVRFNGKHIADMEN